MGKVFNITGDCKPNLHYMVDISSRLKQMKGYSIKRIALGDKVLVEAVV